MILTKKGSTRGNANIMMTVTVIVLVTRLVIQTVESNTPKDPAHSIHWATLPNISEKQLKKEYYNKRNVERNVLVRELEKLYSQKKKEDKLADLTDKKQILNMYEEIANKNKSGKKSGYKRKKLNLEKLLKDNIDKKPLLMVLTNNTNIPCKYFNRVILTNKNVVEKINESFYPIRLNVDEDLTEVEYRVFKAIYITAVVPTIVIADYKAKHSYSDYGMTTSDSVLFFLDKSLKKVKKRQKKDAALEKLVKEYETKIKEFRDDTNENNKETK